jgi:hypothetical protein
MHVVGPHGGRQNVLIHHGRNAEAAPARPPYPGKTPALRRYFDKAAARDASGLGPTPSVIAVVTNARGRFGWRAAAAMTQRGRLSMAGTRQYNGEAYRRRVEMACPGHRRVPPSPKRPAGVWL